MSNEYEIDYYDEATDEDIEILVSVSGTWTRATYFDPGEGPEVEVVDTKGRTLDATEHERICEAALDAHRDRYCD